MKRKLAIGLSVGALLSGVGGVAYAAIPDSGDAEFHACVQNSPILGQNRQLKLIDKQAGESCQSGYTETAWNQAGAQGPQGPPGDPASVPTHTLYGEHGYDIRHTVPAGTNAPGPGGNGFDETCPSGELMISASAWVQAGSNAPGAVDAGALTNRDGSADVGNGVMVVAWNHTADDGELRVVMQCVHVT